MILSDWDRGNAVTEAPFKRSVFGSKKRSAHLNTCPPAERAVTFRERYSAVPLPGTAPLPSPESIQSAPVASVIVAGSVVRRGAAGREVGGGCCGLSIMQSELEGAERGGPSADDEVGRNARRHPQKALHIV